MQSCLKFHASALLLPITLLTACAPPPSSNTYSSAQAGVLQEVQYGSVIGLRNVLIQQDSAEAGNIAGGMGVTGTVVGGTIGSMIDRSVQARPAVEITVRLEDGRTVAIAQLADEPFNIGDSVKILTTKDGKARVTH